MKKLLRRRSLWFLAIVCIAGILALPVVHWRIIGRWRGEPFWRGWPASYYANRIMRPSGEGPIEQWTRNHLSSSLADVFWSHENPFPWIKEEDAPPAEAVPVLIALAESSDTAVRLVASMSLASTKDGIAIAVPALIRSLDDPNPEVRFTTIYLLGKIGWPSRPAIPKLRERLSDTACPGKSAHGMTVGEAAALALTQIDPDERR